MAEAYLVPSDAGRHSDVDDRGAAREFDVLHFDEATIPRSHLDGAGTVTYEAGADAASPMRCSSDSQCGGLTPRCDSITGACSYCRGDADCTRSASPRCDRVTGACRSCTDAFCERTGLRCLASPTSGLPMGSCVECLSDEDCGANTCIRATARCGAVRARSVHVCNACRSSAECASNHACVRVDPGASSSHVCMPRATPGCSVPFGRIVNDVAVEGSPVQTCRLVPHVSCEAWRSFGTPCSTAEDCAGTFGEDDCSSQTSRCTYGCFASTDCPLGVLCAANACAL